jgi:3-deoxy-D-manno-octulosonic-acid transferase
MTSALHRTSISRLDWRLLAYNAAIILAFPVLVAYALWRLVAVAKVRGGWTQRLGFMPALPPARTRVWVHAVSAGEMQAAAPVCSSLLEKMPGCQLVLSTATPAGKKVALTRIPQAAAVLYFPLDVRFCVVRALDAIRPDVCLLIEKELWPNFLAAAKQRGIPVAVLNARISRRSLRRSRLLRGFLKWAMGFVDLFAAQTQRDAFLLSYLGCPAEKITVCGNVKFDQRLDPLSPEGRLHLRSLLGLRNDQPLLLAGSTHPGEEQTLLDALAIIRAEIPGARLLIAPRHIHRAGEVEALIARAGLRCLKRTQAVGQATTPDTVVILDTMGELAGFYGLGEAAFVGGTLVPIGGHDLLQPVAHGLAVFFGPHTFNLPEVADALLEARVGFRVSNARELAEGIGAILGNQHEREEIRRAASSFLDKHRGASARCASAVSGLLHHAAMPHS